MSPAQSTPDHASPTRSIRMRLVALLACCLMLGAALGVQWARFAGVLSLGHTLGVLVSLALCALPLWWVAGRCLAPVQRLADTVAARKPHETTPLTHAPATELEPVVRALNVQWQQQQDALDQQQRFLAEASHQLRTPLAVLKIQLQGALSGELEAADALPKMLRTVDRASHLANQLLSKAKVEQKMHNAQWSAVDLKQVASDVLVEFSPLIARKQLDVALDAVPVQMQTDAWLVGELLRNLLSNAIRQSAPGGSLGVVIRYLPQELELLVWDNAGGMDEALRERLFQPFESASGGTGVGLGLSICKQIAISVQASLDLYNRIQNHSVVGVDAVVRWKLPA